MSYIQMIYKATITRLKGGGLKVATRQVFYENDEGNEDTAKSEAHKLPARKIQ